MTDDPNGITRRAKRDFTPFEESCRAAIRRLKESNAHWHAKFQKAQRERDEARDRLYRLARGVRQRKADEDWPALQTLVDHVLATPIAQRGRRYPTRNEARELAKKAGVEIAGEELARVIAALEGGRK